MKLMQSFTAERMNELGYGRVTFNLEFDKEGRVEVHALASEHPAAYYYPLNDVPLYVAVRTEVEKRYNAARAKKAVFIAFSRFDPASNKDLANTARGGEWTAVCGGGALWVAPGSLAEVYPAFANRTPLDGRRVHDDTDGRSTWWGLLATTYAVGLHELMHTWDLPHSRDPLDVIAGRGFQHINRFFCLVEPPSKANPRFSEPPDGQATYIAPISGSALRHSRWFALDDRPWKDGGGPRITLDGKTGDILIEAEHGLGYLGFDVNGDAAGYKSLGPPDRDPPRSYRLTAAELQELAGTTEVRIRAVDVQGQYKDAETKKLKP